MPYKAAVVLEKEMATGRIDSTLESLNMLVDAWILAQESEKAESVFNEIINSYNDEKSRLRLGQLHIENEKWGKAVDVLNIELESEDLTLTSKINLLLGIAQFNTENIAVYFIFSLENVFLLGGIRYLIPPMIKKQSLI